jgi:hypothetical protein
VALRGRLRGDRRLDWLFIPSFFGFAYAWGFYTFLIAAPLGLLFLLLAHRYADRPTPALGVVLFLADLALFFSHGLMFLFANFIGGMFLLVRCRRVAHLLPALLPYVAIGVWCLIYALVGLRLETGRPGTFFDVTWGWDLTPLDFLIFSVGWPTMGGFAANWTLVTLLLLMLGAPLVLGAHFNRRDSAVFLPFLAVLLVWAFVPDAGMSTWFLYQRFALFLLPFYALMFQAPDPVTRGGIRRLWLPLLCWAFLALYTERLRAFAAESAAFDEVLATAEPGHRALGLMLDSGSAAIHSRSVYAHFPLWYQAEKAGFVDFNFAVYLPEVVRYRLDRAPATFRDVASASAWRIAEDFDWTRDQAAIYRYFFVRHTAPLPPAYFPAGRCAPVLLTSAGPWSIFENVNCHAAMLPGARVDPSP